MYKKYRDADLSNKLGVIGVQPLDVMVTGVTGSGKSTTLNSVFQKEVAKVGRGADPETMDLESYRLSDSFRLWDTPGLGDGVKKDGKHAKNIIKLLYKSYSVNSNNNKQYGFIDMVLVIIDGSSKDMGTSYKLLNEVIIPNFQKKRILVAINQADMAMKGRYWNSKEGKPTEKLKEFLEDQVSSIKNRVKEATNVNIVKPIYYSAEYGYNVNVLIDLLIDNMPTKKRNFSKK